MPGGRSRPAHSSDSRPLVHVSYINMYHGLDRQSWTTLLVWFIVDVEMRLPQTAADVVEMHDIARYL